MHKPSSIAIQIFENSTNFSTAVVQWTTIWSDDSEGHRRMACTSIHKKTKLEMSRPKPDDIIHHNCPRLPLWLLREVDQIPCTKELAERQWKQGQILLEREEFDATDCRHKKNRMVEPPVSGLQLHQQLLIQMPPKGLPDPTVRQQSPHEPGCENEKKFEKVDNKTKPKYCKAPRNREQCGRPSFKHHPNRCDPFCGISILHEKHELALGGIKENHSKLLTEGRQKKCCIRVAVTRQLTIVVAQICNKFLHFQ